MLRQVYSENLIKKIPAPAKASAGIFQPKSLNIT